MSRRTGGLLAVLILVASVAALRPATWRALVRAGWMRPWNADETVVLVVLDTVRSDHLSLCGHQRPTSPNLDRLAASGAVWTCNAYAPGSWTLPSHASYFTGLPVLEHGAHELPSAPDAGVVATGTSVPANALEPRFQTLAEWLGAGGYQTVLVSANPVLDQALGLQAGFDLADVASFFGQHDGSWVAGRVERALVDDVDPLGGPLLLVVNIADAHTPWAGVPASLGWGPERDGLTYNQGEGRELWEAFLGGTMAPETRAEFLERIDVTYDAAVLRADAALGEVLDVAKRSGWCGPGCRIVVTSDHGEMLGEHGAIDHGFLPWEGNARVPLLVLGADVERLPEPISALHAYHLARDGRLPDTLAPVEQVFWPHVQRSTSCGCSTFAARGAMRWEGGRKLIWMNGFLARFDVAADPGEQHPLPPGPLGAEFEATIDAVVAVQGRLVQPDDAVLETLKAAGYVE